MALLFGLAINNLIAGQTDTADQEDKLQGILFYTMVPKLIEFNTQYTPTYRLRFNDSMNSEYEYAGESVGTLNIKIPVLSNKNGWGIMTTADYYNYQTKPESIIENKEQDYSVFCYGVRVIKKH